jgi:VWFA-related protein
MFLVFAGQAEQPAQRFKSSIDVVQVDVSVIDVDGRPVPDLTAADFELRVDGRRRPIVSAQFVSVPAEPAPPAVAPPAHFSTNVEVSGGRLIMIVVDRAGIASGRGKAAIEAASRFVRTLHRADRVALATIPQGPQVPFTADHALVQRLLQHVDGEAVPSFGTRNIGITDALAFERKDDSAMGAAVERECGVASVGGSGRAGGQSEVMVCQHEVRSEALQVAADARARARTAIRGLEALIDSLPPTPTPKILVFISEGLVVERESAQLSWLDAKAAAKHVTVYPLHLESSGLDASQRRPPARQAADRAVQEQGLSVVAQATRGDVFRILSNSDFAFQRLSSELSGYYLLGFEADAGDRNGRPHAIGVGVRRRGVTVRSRRQFAIGPATVKTAESEIVTTLRDPLPATEVPIKVTTYTFRHPHHDKMRLLVAAEVDRSINPEGQMSVGYVLVDFDGQLTASQMNTALPAPAPQARGSQHYFSTADVEAGKHTLKLVVVDDAGRRGSVERVADVRLVEAGPVRASDLLLSDGGGRAGELPLAPAVSGDITRGSLHGYLEIYADTPDVLERASVTLEVVDAGSSRVVARVPVQLETTAENSRSRTAAARVNLARMPPGDYLARAVIAVGLDEVGQSARPFRIAPGRH